MGNSASASSYSVANEAPPAASDATRGARLYTYDVSSAKWAVHRALVDVSFSNAADEDDEGEEGGVASAWHVEVRALPSPRERHI